MVAHAVKENEMQQAINAANNLFMFEWVLLLNMLLCWQNLILAAYTIWIEIPANTKRNAPKGLATPSEA
jgi:hypothetical protein